MVGCGWMDQRCIYTLSTNPAKWSNTFKQFVGNRMCLTILCGWGLKGEMSYELHMKKLFATIFDGFKSSTILAKTPIIDVL